VKKGHAHARGFLGFNALLQFDPFYFETDIRISVEVSYRGRSFLGVDMEFLLSGPAPWRAKGYAKIKVLFFSLKLKFNYSWGSEQKLAPTFIQPDLLLEKLKIQLQQSDSWSAKLPERINMAESMRSLDESEKQEQIFIHPSGQLELRQSLIPLNQTIEKVGNSFVEQKTSYQISNFSFGEGAPVDANKINPVLEYFSRGQFVELADNEKLSTPDFDLMSAGIELSPGQTYDIPAEFQFTPSDFEEVILEEEGILRENSEFNWQEIRGMNLEGTRKAIDVSQPLELFGMLEELPEQPGKAFKILSKESLESPEQLKEGYFYSYSSAREYLQTHWQGEQQDDLQILSTEIEASEKIVTV
jgi:hypothetical protein